MRYLILLFLLGCNSNIEPISSNYNSDKGIKFYYEGELQGEITGKFSSPLKQIQMKTDLVEIDGSVRSNGQIISDKIVTNTILINGLKPLTALREFTDGEGKKHKININNGLITLWEIK